MARLQLILLLALVFLQVASSRKTAPLSFANRRRGVGGGIIKKRRDDLPSLSSSSTATPSLLSPPLPPTATNPLLNPNIDSTLTPPTTKGKQLIPALKNALASGLSTAAVKLILAPLDTIKTIQQKTVSSSSSTFASSASNVAPTLGLWRTGRQLVEARGIGSLYSGIGVTVLGSMPSVGFYFGVYHYVKKKGEERILQRYKSKAEKNKQQQVMVISQRDKIWNVAIAAAIGNTVASTSRVPYEVVKQKLQTNEYSSTSSALLGMFKGGGVSAFFPPGGIGVQMVRDIPYAVVTLICYEMLQERWVRPSVARRKARALEAGKMSSGAASYATALKDALFTESMIAGALAGGIGSFVTNPMDVLKTRIQTSSSLYNGSILKCVQMTLQDEGIQAFGKGVVPRLVQKIPANGLFFLFYEAFRRGFKVEG
jgi:solute carrier family 25 S-adenosylmethionine transporter 26